MSAHHGDSRHQDHAGHSHAEPVHHDHSKHDHAHDHAPTVAVDNQSRVLWALGLTAAFMLVEVVGGWLSGSLALLADAGHMLTDVAALALAWAAFHFGRRAASTRRTFGYLRLEVLAGFVNALMLLALVIWIAYEAVMRLRAPSTILAGPMFAVALAGLVINLIVFRILHRADTEHVNIQGALIHVLGDLLGSAAAVIAAAVIHFTGWTAIDPILSVLILVLVLRSAMRLLRNSIHILLEGAPADVDIAAMGAHLVASIDGLHCVEHVHVWSITSGKPAATLEAHIKAEADPRAVTRAIKRGLSETFGIAHSTVEIVWDEDGSCALGQADELAHRHD
ncbi:MAG: cation diffusion facilitator family transporter [Xanthomonadales bacterium]|nr:cation diffusion facilitator family transporter [Xanthomonadales bacterium]